MTKILITGDNSFIGTNFLKISKCRQAKEISLKLHQPEDIDFSGFDVVLHLAAIVHRSKKTDIEDYFLINRDLSIRVAEEAKKGGVKQFIFLSTSKVYGRFIAGSEPWNENSACNPDDSYGKSKYEAELGLKDLSDNNFTVSIVRTPIVYGNSVKANMLKLIKLVECFPILPFANVDNKRNYTSIENLVGFIDRIIELKASGTFIAMDDDPLSTTELIEYISKYLGKKIVLFKLPGIIRSTGANLLPAFFDRLFGSAELNNSNTKKILDFNPPYSTEDGIRKMIDSYKNSKTL